MALLGDFAVTNKRFNHILDFPSRFLAQIPANT